MTDQPVVNSTQTAVPMHTHRETNVWEVHKILQEYLKEWLMLATKLDAIYAIRQHGLCKFVFDKDMEKGTHAQPYLERIMRKEFRTSAFPFDDCLSYHSDHNKHLNPKRRKFVTDFIEGRIKHVTEE